MIDLQHYIMNSKLFRKFRAGDLLFVEYKCPLDDSFTGVWWQHNFFAYVLSGQMVWKTPKAEYVVHAGKCYFAKKGSVMARTHPQENYCELIIFVPDGPIREAMEKYHLPLGQGMPRQHDTVFPLEANDVLISYFHSMLSFFALPSRPSETLLKLKFEELIVHLLSSGGNKALKSYFRQLCVQRKTPIKEVMEANFFSNLKQEQFATLCSRSLSAFKRDFKSIYQTAPGKWLMEKRLDHAKYLLDTTAQQVSEVYLNCGFENKSHFIRAFREKFGQTPGKFKLMKKDPGISGLPNKHTQT